MTSSFNNWLVDSLRKGSAQAVDSLMAMGQGPSVVLDWVDPQPVDLAAASPSPLVASHSIWFWVHQAPAPAASQRCWDGWLIRELAQLPTPRIDTRLKALFEEAVSAGLSSGEFAPLLETWSRTLEFSEAVEGAWDRRMALLVFSSFVSTYPQASSRLLETLELEGLADRPDLLEWARDESGVWDKAARMVQPDVLRALGHVCSPVPASLLVRLEGHLLQGLEKTLMDGVYVWQHEHNGARLLSCLDVIREQGLAPSPDRVPDRLPGLIDAVLNESAWISEDLSQLKSWHLGAALPSVSVKKTARSRF